MEVLKNCSVLADCSFIGSLLCDNFHKLINSCSIQCCTGELCNNKTYQYGPSPVTRGSIENAGTRANFTQTVTRATITDNASRTPQLSGIGMTSAVSWVRGTIAYERSFRSRTSAKSQEDVFSSAYPAMEPTVKVRALCGEAKRIYVLLPVLVLMTILGCGINYK